MEEVTIKTPIPKWASLLVFLLGVYKYMLFSASILGRVMGGKIDS
jgi:hypothetical protein